MADPSSLKISGKRSPSSKSTAAAKSAASSSSTTATEPSGEHTRHPFLIGTGEIVQIIRESKHSISCQHIGPSIGRLCSGHCFTDRSIGVQQVKNAEAQFPILFLKELFGDTGGQQRYAGIVP